jgi:O-antigen/teichoic acid export membrane protein
MCSLFTKTPFKVSLVASFSSRFIGAILGVIAIPLYVNLIGIESYGLVGVFASLQSIFKLFDFGLAPTIIREFGKSSGQKSAYQRLSDLAKACEIVYIGIAVIICIILITIIPWLVDSWININELNSDHVKVALCIAAFALAIQWPSTLYTSGLVGLHKQVELAIFNITITIARVLSTLSALFFLSPTIYTFFIVSLIFSIIEVFILRLLMWKKLPKANDWYICKVKLLEVKGFIGVMSLIALCSVLLMQLDKIILSNILSLKDFGVYSLIVALAGGIYLTVSPIFFVVYPKFSSLAHSAKDNDILVFYHKSAQLLSLILIPIMTIVIFFSEKILFVWTGDAAISSYAKWPLIFLVIGNSLNGMMNVPYALQLAYGKPKIALFNNMVAIIFLLPSIYYLAKVYGMAGGAFAWLVLNFLYVLVSQYITHRKLLNTDLLKWYWVDVGLPFLASLVTTFIFYKITPLNMNRMNIAFYLSLVFLQALLVVFFLLPEIRYIFLNFIKNYRLSKK